MNEKVKMLIDNIASGKVGDIREQVDSIVSGKAIDALEVRKVQVAKNLFKKD